MGTIKIEELSCDAITVKPRDVDWGREFSSDADETFYESQRCETCGTILTFGMGYSGGKHRDAVHEDSVVPFQSRAGAEAFARARARQARRPIAVSVRAGDTEIARYAGDWRGRVQRAA
jgi:hypothetical protein